LQGFEEGVDFLQIGFFFPDGGSFCGEVFVFLGDTQGDEDLDMVNGT
jgi:hypothetical protein